MRPKKSPLQSTAFGLLLGLAGVVIIAYVLYQYPPVNERLSWRVDYAVMNIKSWFNPVEAVPTARPQETALAQLPAPALSTATATVEPSATPDISATPAATATPEFTPTPSETPTPIPAKVVLDAPLYEKEDLNACGPATLTMHLRYFGWGGDQKTISDVIKPVRADRNVNVEELYYYSTTQTVGLHTVYRVGGNTDLLKRIIAAGLPVMVETGFRVEKTFWVNDDRWVGHYLLLTGYDDATSTFVIQDSEIGPNIRQTYEQIDRDWEAFNRVYIIIYPADQEPLVKSLLGEDWDMDVNRQNALDAAKAETEADPKNGYAWFNLGTNLVYFDRYSEAATAYDSARQQRLPQRMLRYQFGPFMAYFHSNRTEDLIALADYALERTPNSEEALLWKGWAKYRLGEREDAINLFSQALEERPGYPDAQYALNYVYAN